MPNPKNQKDPENINVFKCVDWLRGQDLNLRPSGYEGTELRHSASCVGNLSPVVSCRRWLQCPQGRRTDSQVAWLCLDDREGFGSRLRARLSRMHPRGEGRHVRTRFRTIPAPHAAASVGPGASLASVRRRRRLRYRVPSQPLTGTPRLFPRPTGGCSGSRRTGSRS